MRELLSKWSRPARLRYLAREGAELAGLGLLVVAVFRWDETSSIGLAGVLLILRANVRDR